MIIFYILAVVLVYFSWKSYRGGNVYLNYFKKELARPAPDFTPPVSIIAPCRGLDPDLEENLTALFQQDFPAYEVIFVVDDETDAAVSIIKRLIRRTDAAPPSGEAGEKKVTAKLIVAGKSIDSSQKVHNLRQAVLATVQNSEIFVFVDSDAKPSENWLKNLIAPLKDEKIGCSTGYRWYISKRRNFASELRSVWNASIASFLGTNMRSNFCWGGSTAVRRETFARLNIREKWRGTLSDDFTVTRAMQEAHLPIYFVPQALTASIEDCTLKELLEFTTRQMKITRVYAPHLWKQSFIGSFLFNLVFIWGILIIAFCSIGELSFWLALGTLLLVSAFSIGKAWLRLMAVKMVLKDYAGEIKKQFWAQNALWILAPALFFYNGLCAWTSRKIVWRGIKYELISPNRTSIVSESK